MFIFKREREREREREDDRGTKCTTKAHDGKINKTQLVFVVDHLSAYLLF